MEGKSSDIIKEGIDKGYLENRKVYIKPVIMKQPMLLNQKGHAMEFMGEGCKWGFMLGVNKRGDLENPFKTEEERNYFEKIWGRSLNPRDDKDNYWTSPHSAFYIEKSQELMAGRKYLDLSIPEDNLKYRVLKTCVNDFADGKEDYDMNPYRKFILVDENNDINEKSTKLKDYTDVYIEIGKIRSSKTEMIKFLTLYYAMKRTGKIVPEDNDSEWYESEVMNCVEKDFETCKRVIDDKDRELKTLISNGLLKGAVERVGVASFRLPGMTESYSMDNFISLLRQMKEETDPLYMILIAQAESSTKKSPVKK